MGKDGTGLFIVMKTSNPKALQKSFSELFGAVSDIMTEMDMMPDGVGLLDITKFEAESDSVSIVIDSKKLDGTDAFSEIFEMFTGFA